MIGRRVGRQIGQEIGRGIGARVGVDIGRRLGEDIGEEIGRNVGYRLGGRINALICANIVNNMRKGADFRTRPTGNRVAIDVASMSNMTGINNHGSLTALYRQVWVGESALKSLSKGAITAPLIEGTVDNHLLLVGELDKKGKPYDAITRLVGVDDDEAEAVLLAMKHIGDVAVDTDLAVGAGIMAGRLPYRFTNLVAKVGP